ncbi:MAG: Maf family nucleotide pyrophosphatase [Bacteroidales bacterium]|nr:Maf family nucleotide pyrophosphatase [Bacteroidales bacterium]MDY6002521.1 Maf family nucleotide pyrophosphatase [Candidatus Cryptobacteroides sp.]
MNLNDKKIILASNSPRRKELLEGLNIPFTIDAETSFVESKPEDIPHEQIPHAMSEGKSLGFHRVLAPDEILVTSDTMVLCGNEILGKAHSYEEAERMLRLLSGREHQVITAVTIRNTARRKTFSVTTNVYFRELTDEEIHYYINNFKPYDKAGAYGIQEWIGYVGIARIEGSFYNVMGFPTHRFWEELQEFL